jgi:hypothetical protein
MVSIKWLLASIKNEDIRSVTNQKQVSIDLKAN